jgi:hypothetical protein
MTGASARPGDTIPVRPAYRTHLKVDRSGLLSTGLRRRRGEPVIVYSAEDTSLDAITTRWLCGHLLDLHREQINGRPADWPCAPIQVPLAQPKLCTPEYRVWSVARGVDVVYLAPGLGWIAAARPIIVKDPSIRWRLIEALAALARELDHDQLAAADVGNTMSESVPADGPAAAGPLSPPKVGGGARVVFSSDAPPEADDALTDEDEDVLHTVQLVTEFETPNHWAHAFEPLPGLDGYFKYRLTLWPQPSRTVPWLLLRQQVDGRHEKAVVFDDALSAVLAFQQELVGRVRSGQHHLVTRTPWRLWHAARRHPAGSAGASLPARVLAWQNDGRKDRTESRPRRYVNLSAPR